MTEHTRNCASLGPQLLTNPPQIPPCNCGASLRSNVVSIASRGPVENAGGPPLAGPAITAPEPVRTMSDWLRDLADALEGADRPVIRQMICIPVDELGVDTPFMLGLPMNSAEVIGRLEICKAEVLLSLMEPIE